MCYFHSPSSCWGSPCLFNLLCSLSAPSGSFSSFSAWALCPMQSVTCKKKKTHTVFEPCVEERRLQPSETIVAPQSPLIRLQVHALLTSFTTFSPWRICTSCFALFSLFYFFFFVYFVYALETNETCFCLLESMLYFLFTEHLVFVKGTTNLSNSKSSRLRMPGQELHVCCDCYPKKVLKCPHTESAGQAGCPSVENHR